MTEEINKILADADLEGLIGMGAPAADEYLGEARMVSYQIENFSGKPNEKQIAEIVNNVFNYYFGRTGNTYYSEEVAAKIYKLYV